MHLPIMFQGRNGAGYINMTSIFANPLLYKSELVYAFIFSVSGDGAADPVSIPGLFRAEVDPTYGIYQEDTQDRSGQYFMAVLKIG
jgi:hypothetical protein